jgi:hypothetical protein
MTWELLGCSTQGTWTSAPVAYPPSIRLERQRKYQLLSTSKLIFPRNADDNESAISGLLNQANDTGNGGRHVSILLLVRARLP